MQFQFENRLTLTEASINYVTEGSVTRLHGCTLDKIKYQPACLSACDWKVPS